MKCKGIQLTFLLLLLSGFSASAIGEQSTEIGLKRRLKKKINDNELTAAHKGMKDLVFVIQIAENEQPSVAAMKNTLIIGGIKKIKLADGIIRYTAGGEFHSLEKAQFHLGKVRSVLHKNVRLIGSYKGKKVTLSDLEKMGFYKL